MVGRQRADPTPRPTRAQLPPSPARHSPWGRRLIPVLRLMALTGTQAHDRAKTVARGTGWRMLRPKGQLTLRRKVIGRRPGELLRRRR
jgi:hypothetical protein